MPEVRINIGGSGFDVACQEGEEHYLQTAAAMLDAEASVLVDQIGRMPEQRMLLMAGLMLADKTAGLNDKLERLEAQLGEQRARIEELEEGGLTGIVPQASAEMAEPASDPGLEAAIARAEEVAAALEAKAAAA